MTTTKWKLFSLLVLCTGYVAMTACGGGGGGDDGNGNSAQGQMQCYQVPTKCPDGTTDAVKNDGDTSGKCAYACGGLTIHSGVVQTDTTTAINTITHTATQ
ncbi:MAG: hypothetical protein ACXVBE_12915 [Bdellovibrionota bacterium]